VDASGDVPPRRRDTGRTSGRPTDWSPKPARIVKKLPQRFVVIGLPAVVGSSPHFVSHQQRRTD